MGTRSTVPVSWSQLSMLPPERLRIRLSVAVDPPTSTHDIAIEWADRGTGELLGMTVLPIRARANAADDIDRVLSEVRHLLEAVIAPF